MRSGRLVRRQTSICRSAHAAQCGQSRFAVSREQAWGQAWCMLQHRMQCCTLSQHKASPAVCSPPPSLPSPHQDGLLLRVVQAAAHGRHAQLAAAGGAQACGARGGGKQRLLLHAGAHQVRLHDFVDGLLVAVAADGLAVCAKRVGAGQARHECEPRHAAGGTIMCCDVAVQLLPRRGWLCTQAPVQGCSSPPLRGSLGRWTRKRCTSWAGGPPASGSPNGSSPSFSMYTAHGGWWWCMGGAVRACRQAAGVASCSGLLASSTATCVSNNFAAGTAMWWRYSNQPPATPAQRTVCHEHAHARGRQALRDVKRDARPPAPAAVYVGGNLVGRRWSQGAARVSRVAWLVCRCRFMPV